ncbi:glycosyltransferase family 2 protein [Planctomyces sp. SH-PL62]|uniref:glycosyltransferase family 2 protein n=1 Tax=Planctomyces sp. SH-PL62 TaxID=1636152 RepID=UPI00078B96CE|nr:glycosyltransferase family 2 protein [Planctomyces sp. SH-PL62]AMV40953.1 SPBc2 prophage-derived glycosyltransferase SunS [Planctomyces sp. SH-PL62]
MIVRDEETNLAGCLSCVVDLFDEIVVVDTGSVDRTREIAREFGARIYEVPWTDDFSVARNAAIDFAAGDYIFWLDADDRLDECCRRRLRSLFDGLVDTDEAYVASVRSNIPGAPTGFVVDQVRLFPRNDAVRWSGKIHEQILPALERVGVGVRWTDVIITHTGYSDPEVDKRKSERKVSLLLEELQETPDDPFTLLNLGRASIDGRLLDDALGYLDAGLASSKPDMPIRRNLYIAKALAHQLAGSLDDASAACREGLSSFPDDGELIFRDSCIKKLAGDLDGAEAGWRRLLRLERPRLFLCSVDGVYGHLPLRNLALLAEERGRLREAFRLWAEVLRECPRDRQAVEARLRVASRAFGTWKTRLVGMLKFKPSPPRIGL